MIDLDHPDNEDILEIQREVALLSQLRDAANHNITLYHGSWLVDHELWIAMDYASGGSIRTLVSMALRGPPGASAKMAYSAPRASCQMKAGVIEERFAVIITREALVALAYLAKEGVIHRDIKGIPSALQFTRYRAAKYIYWAFLCARRAVLRDCATNMPLKQPPTSSSHKLARSCSAILA